jgi:hypothetical protein
MRRTLSPFRLVHAGIWFVLALGLSHCAPEPAPEACPQGACAPSSPEPGKEVTAQWGGRKDLGAACASALDCYSNQCVDGVCCNTACEGACEACDVAGSEGTCSVLEQGAACDDGSACTLQDTCDGQSAEGCRGTPMTCDSPPGQCHQAAGTCADGACGYTPRPVGSSCDDGNACSLGETCGADQACGGGTLKVCDTPPDVCFQARGTCQPGTGACAYELRAAGSACRPAAGVCDVEETCTGSTGTCPANAHKPAGTACTDDGNACTTDVCNAAGGCEHPPVAVGAACGTGRVCNGSAACVEGCWIAGAYYAPGASNPAGPCQVCNPAQSTSSWSFKTVGTVCRAAAGPCDVAETCTGSSAQCPGDGSAANGLVCGADSAISWGSCEGGSAGTCSQSGTQQGTVTRQRCSSGACKPSVETLSQSCTRNTEGISCGSSGSSGWSACDYGDDCNQEGERYLTTYAYQCSAGTCVSRTTEVSQPCSRNTQGSSCGFEYGSWSGCSFNGTCARAGSQTRPVYEGTCWNSSCNTTLTRYEYASCYRDTTNASCNDGNPCTWGDQCNGAGSCSGNPVACSGDKVCWNGLCICPGSTSMCEWNGGCVDTTSNNNHCGGCGNACPGGWSCINSACVSPGPAPCPGGQSRCNGGSCVDTNWDNAHCGACNNACASGWSCSNGACVPPPCPGGLTSCGGSCVDTNWNNAHCGACGNACPGGTSCSYGSCAGCPSGTTLCDGACVDLNWNGQNCGMCGRVCRCDYCSYGTCLYERPGDVCP